jgi:Flp pilus assembly protein TadB
MTPSVSNIVGSLAGVALILLLLAGSRSTLRRPRLDGVDGEPTGRVPSDALAIVDDLGREVRSGASVRSALSVVLDRHPTSMAQTRLALHRNLPLDVALDQEPAADPDIALVVHAIRRSAAQPHVLPDVLDRTSAVIRERRAWREDRRVHSAQARLSAQVMTMLPLAFAAWGAVTSESVRDAYRSSATAQIVVAVGVVLNALGWCWMRLIIGGRR